jgi:AcrR family transcriptional regulator
MKTPRPKRAYHHGDLKNALVDAALVHIARDGARALSLREVARSAGVSHTASYRHFPSKESLLAAIAEEGFRRLSDGMRTAVRGLADDPAAALRASGVAYVEFGVHYPDHLQVMFGGLVARAEDYPALLATSKEAYELLVAIVRDGLRVGRLHGPDERSVALAAWALVHGLAVLIAGGQVPAEGAQLPAPRELASAVTALLHQGIATAALPAKTARKGAAGRARRRRGSTGQPG